MWRIFTIPLEPLFHLLRLLVELGNAILDTFSVVENEQPTPREIIQHRRHIVQVREVKGDIVKGESLS